MNIALCPDGDALLAHVTGESAGELSTADTASHVRDCERCRHQVEQLKSMVSSLRENFANTTTSAPATIVQVPVPPTPASRPTHLGKYLIVGELGRGGQGQVFRALHPTLGRDVAIKWGPHSLHHPGSDQDRLAAEGNLLAKLDHPGIVRVYDLDAWEGRPFLVMEFVRGRDLEQYASQTSTTPTQAARLVAQIARAVGAAHAQGITHQDIKPSNILMDDAGRPRLADFGIARLHDLWRAGQDQPQGGTLAFMAPEQAVGDPKDIGPLADVFALGGVLYFLLTGNPPRTLPDNLALAYKRAAEGGIDDDRLSRANVPPRLLAICRKALAHNPSARYPSAQALAQALEDYLDRPRRLRRGMAVLSGLLAVVLGLGALLAFPKPAADHPNTGAAAVNPFTLRIVRDGVQSIPKTQQELDRVLPLREKDQLGLVGVVPAGIKVGLFALNLDALPKVEVRDLGPLVIDGQSFRVPGLLPLEKSPATELVFLVGDEQQAPNAGAVQAQLEGWTRVSRKGSAWQMPGNVLVAFDSKGVDNQVFRGMIGDRQEDPVANVVAEVDNLRKKLRARFPFVAGMAFTHVAAAAAAQQEEKREAAGPGGLPPGKGTSGTNQGVPGLDIVLMEDETLFKDVVERLLASELIRKKYPAKFVFPPIYKVQMGTKEINAYATASTQLGAVHDPATGKIRPIIMATEPYMKTIIQGNADILAATMGHELAHVVLDHVSIFNRRDELLPTAFNRDQEINADLEGIRFAVAAGYPYKGGVEGAFKMQKRFGELSSFERLKGTHPSWNDRLAMLDRARAHIWKAMAAFENGYFFLVLEQYRSAEKCFERVTEDFPDCAEAWANLGYAQLMQYCDSLTTKELAKLGIGQFVAGCFYNRPQNLAPVRGDRGLWDKAVKNLAVALKRDPNLLLPMANLGLAYLVHPDGVPDLQTSANYIVKTFERVNKDKGLTDLNLAAFLINASVVDIAQGNGDLADKRLRLARDLARNFPRDPLTAQLLSAINYNEALLLSRGDIEGKRQAYSRLENFLTSASTQSYWWTLALEKFTALGNEIGEAPRSPAVLRLRLTAERLRIVPSVALPDKQLVTLSEDLAGTLQKLGATQVPGLPIYYRSAVKRYNAVRPGVDILGGDQILAIFLTGPQAPPIVLQGAGLGTKKSEVRVGMTVRDFDNIIKGQYKERSPRSVENPAVQFSFLPDLGLGFRVLDGTIAELIVAQIPEKTGP